MCRLWLVIQGWILPELMVFGKWWQFGGTRDSRSSFPSGGKFIRYHVQAAFMFRHPNRWKTCFISSPVERLERESLSSACLVAELVINEITSHIPRVLMSRRKYFSCCMCSVIRTIFNSGTALNNEDGITAQFCLYLETNYFA